MHKLVQLFQKVIWQCLARTFKSISFNPKGPNAEEIIQNLEKDLSTKIFINVNYFNKSKQYKCLKIRKWLNKCSHMIGYHTAIKVCCQKI